MKWNTLKGISRRAWCATVLGGVTCLAGTAFGQGLSSAAPGYKFMVGFAPGGVPDAAARVIANKLSERQKVPAIVENRLGVGGTLAAKAVLDAPADGMTLLSVTPAHATAPAIFKKLPYDTVKDFVPVTMIGEGPAILVVPNTLAVGSVADLVQFAKRNPGKLNYSSAGVGSSSHFAVELLKIQAGIDVVNIPYKGVKEALTEVMTGRVDFHITPYTTAAELVKAGKVRALAVTGRKRIPEMPDVPTVAESGVPGYEWSFWYGLLVSSKVPASVVSRLNSEINGIIRLPDVRRQLEQMGVEIDAGTPESFGKLISSEVEKFAKIARAANIQPE